MWKIEKIAPIFEFLGWILFTSLFVNVFLFMLEPWSIRYSVDGNLTFGYALYAVIGLLFSTPSAVISIYITLKRNEKVTLKEFLGRIFDTPKPLLTIIITSLFCLYSLAFALFYGTPNGSSWYMMPLGFIIMLPFVGISEEPAWRGFLQPQLEKHFHFLVATSITGFIWFAWHLPIWLQPSSNHYGDSIIGFFITIFVWSFASASIYKATKSVIACAIYHSFINSIGGVYDWNALFDTYPTTLPMIIYFTTLLIISIIIWYVADYKEKSRHWRLLIIFIKFHYCWRFLSNVFSNCRVVFSRCINVFMT